MVMDVYDTSHPQPLPDDSGFFLKADKKIMGYYDLLETALHAFDHVIKYENCNVPIGASVKIMRILKNRLCMCETSVVSWIRLEDADHSSHEIPNGKFEFSMSLRTHPIEKNRYAWCEEDD